MHHLDWLLQPITLYSASALCLLVSLTLVVRSSLLRAGTVRLSVAPLDPGSASKPEDPEVRGLKIEMEQLRESVNRLEEAMPVRGSGVGMNVNKRAVALRMHRRGEPVATIATALEAPSNEVALLLKLQALMESKAS
jgi:hypothetical protein